MTSSFKNLSLEPKEPAGDEDDDDDVVDPWNVRTTSKTGIDYDKLISKRAFCHLAIFTRVTPILPSRNVKKNASPPIHEHSVSISVVDSTICRVR